MTPNTMFIPEKYRQFIDSNIRKVYIDNSAEVELQERMEQLEARIHSLEHQKDQLMERCESFMRANQIHAEREKHARVRLEQTRKELVQANEAVAKLVSKEVARAPPIKYEIRRPEERPYVRVGIEQDVVKKRRDRSDLSGDLLKNQSPGRVVAPLPKRLRVRRSIQ